MQRGWGKSPGGGYGCNNYAQADQLDEENIAARNKFRQENATLFKQLVTKKAELWAVYNQQNPNSDKAAALSGEVFELCNAIHKKATEAGLSKPRSFKADGIGTGWQREGFGSGRKYGRGMGPNPMWN
jgi:hypothetical protein